MKKKKLGLNKKIIASLSDIQKSKIIGGDDAYTTSFSNCTHLLCCPDDCEEPSQGAECESLLHATCVTCPGHDTCDSCETCSPVQCPG